MIVKKMTNEEKARKCLERHPDWDDTRISNSANCSIHIVRILRSGKSTPSKTEDSGIVSIEKVIARYDIKAAIIRELARIPKGQLISESELCLRSAGTDRNRFRRTIENNAEEFRLFRIKLKLEESGDGKWYWSDAETITEAQRIRDV